MRIERREKRDFNYDLNLCAIGNTITNYYYYVYRACTFVKHLLVKVSAILNLKSTEKYLFNNLLLTINSILN